MDQQYLNNCKLFTAHRQNMPFSFQWKLSYMIDYVNKRAIPYENLTHSQQNEVQDIIQMEPQAIKLVFNSIMKSMHGQLEMSQHNKCKIKIYGYFQKWQKAYINCSSQSLQISKKKQKLKFPLSGLQLKLKLEEKKIQMGYKSIKKASLKFDSKTSAQEEMKYLEGFVQEHNNLHKPKNSYPQVRSLETEYASFLMKKDLSFYIHKKQPKIHLELIIDCHHDKIMHLLTFFINQSLWNERIKSEQIEKDPFKDRIVVTRVYRSQSILTSDRMTSTEVALEYLDPETYLLLESTTNNIKEKGKTIIGNLETAVLCSKICQTKVKLRIESFFKANGYCTDSQNRKMVIEMWKDIGHFQNDFHFKEKAKTMKVLLEPPKFFLDLKQPEQSQQTDHFETIREDYNNEQMFQEFESEDEESQYSTEKEGQNNAQKREQEKIVQVSQNFPKQNENLSEKLVEKFRKLKPSKYEESILPDYITMLRNKDFQKAYQHEKFYQGHLEEYNSYDPWYCLHELLLKNEYIITENKQLYFINDDLIQGQKNTLKFVIRQIGANLISGKSVMNVSLPVDIFQGRSLLERSAASYGCAPTFLKPISMSDPLTQMKNVFTFIASVPTLELIMQKPFNPILGETFQGYIQGIPIYYEQISHHPPISSYYMKCKEFTMYGNLVAFANVGLNTGTGGNAGTMHIVMENGSHFQCYFPPGEIAGLIYGQRKFRSFGKGFVVEKKNRLFCEFSIQKDSKGVYDKYKPKMLPGDILGGIFSVTPKFIQELSKVPNMRKYSGIKKENIVEKLSSISGVWFEDIYIDGEIINKNRKSFPIQYHQTCLPSDSNFRLDVLFHRMKDLKRSQSQKQVLEQIQRGDRRLREKHVKGRK